MKFRNKRTLACAVGAVLAAQTATIQAAVIGFSSFAPINATSSDSGTVSTNPNIGYTGGGSSFVVTDNTGAEGTSGFAVTPQNIAGSWTASFSYQEIPQVYDGTTAGGNARYVAADGFAFVLQNDSRGTAALGGDGGAYGYGNAPASNTNSGVAKITPDAAITVNNFGGFLSYGGAVGFNTNGSTNTPNGLGTVSIARGLTGSNGTPHTINVTYSYNAASGQVKETFVDPSATFGTASQQTYVHVDSGINLASTLGGNTALIGFTGGTGGFNAKQTISNFNFTTGTAGASPTASVVSVYNPIALAGSSFNQAIVVPASASGTGASTSNPVLSTITATIDAGHSITSTSTGYTFFEKGFVAGGGSTPSNANAGLPTSGSQFSSDARHSFVMPTFGTTGGTPINDAVLLDDGDTGAAGDKTATITFANPQAYSALSFLTASGNGPGLFSVTVNYANGVSIPIAGDVVSPDWFGSGNLAYATGGRYEVDNNSYNINSGGQPNLWQVDVATPDAGTPITSLTLNYTGGDRSEVAIFSVSGAVPEPSSMGCLAIAGLGLLGRRRRHHA